MPHLTFLRHIKAALMKKTESEKNINLCLGLYAPVNTSVHFDDINHVIFSVNKQFKCKICKKKNT